MKKKLSVLLALCLLFSLAACGGMSGIAVSDAEPGQSVSAASVQESSAADAPAAEAGPGEPEPAAEVSSVEASAVEEPIAVYEPTEEELAERQVIEDALNLKNMDQQWYYSADADAWVMAPLTDVINPVLPDYQGVSVAAPGPYISGIDTDGDGSPDVTAADMGEDAVSGVPVIDHNAEIVSPYGQTYTADTCPVILTTGAAGYGSQKNGYASTYQCFRGYVAVSCGNRGKQSYVADAEGNVEYYTGDAPSCLCDQKAATRFVKYNMLLGNLPGSVDYWVSTGGSGGAAHAAMYAATSNHPDFYDYQIEAGAVGVYRNSDGSYSTEVTIDGDRVSISDGVWGAIPYSAITSLYEADMAQAFEYYMDPTYLFNTEFQARLASYLSLAYMDYINGMGWTVNEADVGFDLDDDGALASTIDLSIEYDSGKYADTHGFGGTYLDLYLAQFRSCFQWYLDNLDYAQGWTWFDENGNPLSDNEAAAMTSEDKATAFIEGRYTKASTGFGGPPGRGAKTDGVTAEFGDDIRNGGPDAGSTAAVGAGSNSRNYASFDEMVESYASDIAGIEAGDAYGKNIVDLYNPINYIGAEGTDAPTWTRIIMGAVEGDMPMMASLNMQIKWLSSGTSARIEWQWDGGHVPNEILGESLGLYVDEMYGRFVSGIESVKPDAEPVTANGDSEAPEGKDLSSWVDYADVNAVSFTLADVLAYRNTGAMKAVPGFDVIDYGQEDYVFGSPDQDARHWNSTLLDILQDEEKAAVLRSLF